MFPIAGGVKVKREDLTNHDKYHIYLKLAIDGKSSKPFSALTLPPFYKFKPQGSKEKIIKVSRQRYSYIKSNSGPSFDMSNKKRVTLY
jgi:hypothetical protein